MHNMYFPKKLKKPLHFPFERMGYIKLQKLHPLLTETFQSVSLSETMTTVPSARIWLQSKKELTPAIHFPSYMQHGSDKHSMQNACLQPCSPPIILMPAIGVGVPHPQQRNAFPIASALSVASSNLPSKIGRR